MVFLERSGAAMEGMGEWPEDAGMVGGRLARDSCVWSRMENERSHSLDRDMGGDCEGH